MSVDLSRIYSRPPKSQFAWRFASLLAIVYSFSILGCGSNEPKEISAATSGYLPSKEQEAKSSVATSKAAVEKPGLSTGSGNQTTLPIAPAVPSFEPGKLDPKIASQLYMTLKLGDLNGSKPLMEFIDTSTRAFRELLADARNTKKQLPKDILLDRGMILSRMKLEAAQRLAKLASNEDEKAASKLGIIEAYSQMAGFGDVAALDSLRETVSKEIKNSDPRVAQQALSITLGLLVSDYDSGSAKLDELVSFANSVLASGSELTGANLNAMIQVVEVLSKHSEEEAALTLAKKTEEAFRDHRELQFALSAWELHASHLKETNELGGLLQSDSKADLDPLRARELCNALMMKIASPWTAFFLVQVAIKIEYSGRPLIAKELIDVAELQVKNLKNVEAQEELDRNCKQFMSRIGILNKPLDLSELVDTAGQPVDLSRYKGKVVLVDFWATWCGPCIQEIPNIEGAFASHNKDGFEVISINLDTERPKLDAFLASKKLMWSTYVSSKQEAVGFDTPLAKQIGISAIPFIALIGKDGNVAGIHVRGRNIKSKIVELLAKE